VLAIIVDRIARQSIGKTQSGPIVLQLRRLSVRQMKSARRRPISSPWLKAFPLRPGACCECSGHAWDADAKRIEAAADRLPPGLARDILRKGKVGSARAMARVLAGLPVHPFHHRGHELAFRYLKPGKDVPPAIDAPVEMRDAQASIAVWGILVNAGGRSRISREPFGVCFTAHALGRLLDRSCFAADPTEAMLEAHNALIALGPVEGSQAFNLDDLPVPACNGAFLTSPRRIGPQESPLAVARSWLAGDQLRGGTAASVSMWEAFLEA
jgi:hypothetical protein